MGGWVWGRVCRSHPTSCCVPDQYNLSSGVKGGGGGGRGADLTLLHVVWQLDVFSITCPFLGGGSGVVVRICCCLFWCLLC